MLADQSVRHLLFAERRAVRHRDGDYDGDPHEPAADAARVRLHAEEPGVHLLLGSRPGPIRQLGGR